MFDELCSVIMPAYNAERFIEASIESVLGQTYPYIEFIIIDDCSSDNTKNIIKKYAEYDKRIKFIKNDTNLGCAETRNKAITMSHGNYIAFIDSDDVWECSKLEVEVKEIKKRQCDLIYTSYKMIDSNNHIIKIRSVPEKLTMDLLLKENFICFSSVLLKTELAKEHKMYSAVFHEDFYYLLNLLNNGAVFLGLNKSLVKYRVSEQNRSKNKFKAAKYRWLIYRKYLNLGIYDSFRYFSFYFFNGIKKYYM